MSDLRRVLFVNPRSGKGGPTVEELAAAAREVGVHVHALRRGDDLATLAREAEVDVLGMAGGDGSLGAVAEVAIERDLPFVCVPWGTRNHFATDVGLDGDDPLAALAAFRHDAAEWRVDVGRTAEGVFLNNVSFGLYARLVHRRERRRRRRETFARLRSLALTLFEHRRFDRFVVDGRRVRASVLLIANNEYQLDLFSLGARERLDGGLLSIYAARGIRRLRWTERTATSVRVDSNRPAVRAAVDGEPALLRPPVELRVDPGALRLLLPPGEDETAAGSEALEQEQ